MQWLLLAFGVVGVYGTICMKLSDGFLSGGLSGLWYRCCGAAVGCAA
jgi:multidrug transporter EmrE-like cation transporter